MRGQIKLDAHAEAPRAKGPPVLTFDLLSPFPERYEGRRFGPVLIEDSLKAGNYVLAELVEVAGQYPVQAARWEHDLDGLSILQVLTVQGWRVPQRLFTLKTLQGFKL